jgi:hypothetical protein
MKINVKELLDFLAAAARSATVRGATVWMLEKVRTWTRSMRGLPLKE